MSIAKKNRDALFDKLEPNSIAILSGSDFKYRSKDVQYAFRQNSDFFYLTAFNAPNALAVFIKPATGSDNQFILFHQNTNTTDQIWHGNQYTTEQILAIYKADLVYDTEQLNNVLPELIIGKETIYYPFLENLDFIKFLHTSNIKAMDLAKKTNRFYQCKAYRDLLAIVHELRVFKSALELDKMRYVTRVSAEAHQHVMRYVATNKNLTERHVHAEFYKYCLQAGCDDMAYPPIVAAGENACILHYHKNSAVIKEEELLLIDAGAEYQYYAADITRVFPVNGKFSHEQKAIYDLVLSAQKQAIKNIRPGQTWSNLQQEIIEILVSGLIELKILHGNKSDLIRNLAYKNFYMHNSGHFLGLDVHDVGSYKNKDQARSLLPGMVLTVEPGLYFSKYTGVDPKWHGIGIRIEDDILVTENGHEILTTNVPKEIAEIENLMLN